MLLILDYNKWGPIDLTGIPFYNQAKEKTVYAPPSILPDKASNGILFLDELPTASRAVQASSMQLVLDRRIGQYNLPDGWKIVAAGNDVSDNLASHEIIAPLANRFLHFKLEPDLFDWFEWAYDKINFTIIDFLLRNTEYFCTSNREENNNLKAFPTPRSWEFVSNQINNIVGSPKANKIGYTDNLSDVDKDKVSIYCNNIITNPVIFALVNSAVGNLATVEFFNFLRMTEDRSFILPNPKEFVRLMQDDIESLVVFIKKAMNEQPDEITNYIPSVCKHSVFYINRIAYKTNNNLSDYVNIVVQAFLDFLDKTQTVISPDLQRQIIMEIKEPIFVKYNNLIITQIAREWKNRVGILGIR